MSFDVVTGPVLERARRDAERLMVDACTIMRVDRDNPVRDPATGTETFSDLMVYEGKCKIQRYDGQIPTESDVAGRVVTIDRLTLHLPISAVGILLDDMAEVTASAFDPELVGSKYRVAMVHAKSMATARRMVVEEVTG